MDKYIEQIKKIADNELNTIQKQGYANAGVNGPYNFRDTPARNSAHWCYTYCFLYKKTKDYKYFNTTCIGKAKCG